jgi:LysM repeat protein
VPPTATTAPITQALVRIDPADINVNVNDTFNLFVKVDNATNLSILELHLSFDPNILEVKQLINGGFLAADIVAQNTYDNSAGTIDYTIAQNGRAPAQGGGTLLTIMFRAKNSGTVNVNKRATQSAPNGVILADLNRTSLPATWTGGKVTVATPPTPPNPPVINRIHVVRWGEWLYCIGRAYKVDPWTIAQQNGIWLPYVIFPGQQLSIPNTPWTNMSAGTACQPQFSVAPQPVPPAPTTPSPVVTVIVVTPVPSTPVPATPIPSYSCRVTYVVNRGDTLYSIGRMYGISYEEIARVNSIANPRLIYNGQRLCIP